MVEMSIILREATYTINVRGKDESRSFKVSTSLDMESLKDIYFKKCDFYESGKNKISVVIMLRRKGEKPKSKSFTLFLKTRNYMDIFNRIRDLNDKFDNIKEVPNTTHVLVVKNILCKEQTDTKCFNVTLEKDINIAIEELKEYVTKELCNVLENDIVFTGISRNTSSHRIMLWTKDGKAKSRCFTIMFPNYSSEEIMEELKKGFKK